MGLLRFSEGKGLNTNQNLRLTIRTQNMWMWNKQIDMDGILLILHEVCINIA